MVNNEHANCRGMAMPASARAPEPSTEIRFPLCTEIKTNLPFFSYVPVFVPQASLFLLLVLLCLLSGDNHRHVGTVKAPASPLGAACGIATVQL